jgi:hypothetical protein
MKKINVIKSNKFTYAVIGFFIIQAAWFALTARYPMAFDENYHFGLIQLFSHQWLPFITNTQPEYGVYGDITRYTSYLYHYLMSFPYRLITVFAHQQVTQIIILRFINISIFVGGLLLFRSLFQKLNISKSLINFSLLMLILIPVVPFLAATISYDNLMFLLVPLVIILALNCRDAILQHDNIPAASFILLLTFGILGSLVKYAFLPIITGIIIYLLFIFMRASSKKKLLKTIWRSFRTLKYWSQIALIIGITISSGLFIERYGVNLVVYHKLEPECAKIQNTEYCSQFGPWARDARIADDVAINNPGYDPPILLFVPYWFDGMIHRLYFAINYNYNNNPALPIPIAVASFIGGIGLILCLIFRRFIIRIDRRLLLFVVITAFYVGSILYINFTDFLQYRKMLAINGRYLTPILPLLFILIGLAYHHLFDNLFKKHTKQFTNITAVTIVLLLLQGGGASTYLVRSQADWYLQNQSIIDFNLSLKNIVAPFIVGGTDY